MAVDLGPHGVRVVCLRPQLLADAAVNGSYTNALFERRAAAAGVTVEQLLERLPGNTTLLGRLPTLGEVAATAVFLASDGAAAMTGAVVDLTSGHAVRNGTGALVGIVD